MAVADIAYVVFDHVDLEVAERFYLDFGLHLAYRTAQEVAFRPALKRGYCYVARKADRNGLVAIGMRAPDMQELERLSRFPDASAIEQIERPGGGLRVRLASPDGLPFEVTFGIEEYPELPVRAALPLNHGREKVRFGEWQRPELSPAAVLRLGHVALLTNDFKTNAAWLETRLGLKPSDLLFDGTRDNQLGGFFHCTGGLEWTDHHTLALFPGDVARVHHCSFEIEDLDAQFLGNKWLAARGWKHTWGVGRHILGSQIFDYWQDPAGNICEHFTDGDLIKPGTPPGYHQVSDDGLAQWGPPLGVADFINAAVKHP